VGHNRSLVARFREAAPGKTCGDAGSTIMERRFDLDWKVCLGIKAVALSPSY
jgi:hypothetical protein